MFNSFHLQKKHMNSTMPR